MSYWLVVDDEPSICWALSQLGDELKHEVRTAGSAEAGLEIAAAESPRLVVLDVRLPGMDGLSAIEKLRPLIGDAPIIVITAFGDLDTAVEAVRQGAFEYVVKPFDLASIENVIGRAIAAAKQTESKQAANSAQTPLGADNAPSTGLVGSSAAMQEVFRRIALAAPRDACVLLQGESGVGKELAARALHQYGGRRDGPFVAVNVAALNPALAESELFGHLRGAFTGADSPRKGLLQQADGGVLFLDEVAEIPLTTQVKLLRCLEHGEVLPVGAEQPVATNFRIVAATHRDLAAMAAEGEFRHDLFYRLTTFQIDLPPLRERSDDVSTLAQHFLREFDPEGSMCIREDALVELGNRDWWGNVRELRNAIEHAAILARGTDIGPEHLPPPAPKLVDSHASSLSDSVVEFDEGKIEQLLTAWAATQLESDDEPLTDLYERLLALVEPPVLQAALKKHNGQFAAAARELGIHRTTLRKKLE